MTKTQQAMQEIAKPSQETLDRFLKNGGTAQEFAVAHPFETGILYALNALAMKLY